MELKVEPHVAVGPLRFGMSVDEARRAFASPVQSFMKAPFSTFPTDASDQGVQLHYRPPGTLTAVEVFSPASIILAGERFLGRPYSVCRYWLKQQDAALREDRSGCTSIALGVGLFSPCAATKPDDPVLGVIAFERGYYDHVEWSIDMEKLEAFKAQQAAKKP